MFEDYPVGFWVVVTALFIAYVAAYMNPLEGALLAIPMMTIVAAGSAQVGYEVGGGLGMVGGLVVGGIFGSFSVPMLAAAGAAHGL